jgi:hypothetical protein
VTEEKQEIIEALYRALPLAIAQKFPPEEVSVFQRAVLDAIDSLVPDEEYEGRLLASAVVAPYLEGHELARSLEIWLAAAQQSSRNAVLLSLAFMQAIHAKLVEHRPELAGNLIVGSPLKRLGGPTSVGETLKAIADVCSWWP